MAFTLNQLTALETAISSGRLEVEFDGKRVKYQRAEDLASAYRLVKAQLQADGSLPLTTDTNRGPSTLAQFDRS